MGFTLTSAHGQLTVGGNNTQSPCSKWTNLQALLRDEDVIGNDTRVSGGKVLNPQRGDGFTETIEGLFCGDVDRTGSTNADVWGGLADNIDWFKTNITTRTGSGDGTRALVLTLGGNTYNFTARIQGLRVGATVGRGIVRATFDVWVPRI